MFFPMVVAIYFWLPDRFRWILLLIASYYFYMCWNYKYVVLLLFTTVICYICAIWIHRSRNQLLRKSLLIFTLFSYLGTLFFFKYFNFVGNSINILFQKFNIFYNVPAYHYLLPVGISFYTFQALSYTIDVYKGSIQPEYHFGKFALFKSFFPQLVAGPIERASNMLPQFSQKHKFEYENLRDGVAQMLWGFFKKVVIADRLAKYVNLVYNNPTDYHGAHYIIATLFFTFQIYCDFSGYSDIALGTAKVMGYKLMTNFRRPYMSVNIREFWQRWHISLSTWFRDYLYISMGGNRVVKWRRYFNLFITFVVSGLWHGANWTFIVWGALHGFYMVFAMWISGIRERFNNFVGLARAPGLHKVLQQLTTFVLAYFAWIFFRANSLSNATYIIRGMLHPDFSMKLNLYEFRIDFFLSFFLILILMAVEFFEERYTLYTRIRLMPKFYKWSLAGAIGIALLILGVWESSDFIYFQF